MKTKEFYEGLLTACIIEFEEVEGKFVEEKDFKFDVEMLSNKVRVLWSYTSMIGDQCKETGDSEIFTKSSWELFDANKLDKIYFSFWEVCKEVEAWEIKTSAQSIVDYREYIEENINIEEE